MRRMIALSVLVNGCFGPDYGGGNFSCEQEQLCPDGYQCVAVEPNTPKVCRKTKGGPQNAPGITFSFTNPTVDIQGKTIAFAPDGKLKLDVSLQNFQLVNKKDQPPVPGQGHIHVYIDDPDPLTTKGYIGSFIVTTIETEAKVNNVEFKGKHTLYVLLVENNHTHIAGAVAQADFWSGPRP